jgi:hypothetical protein
MSLGGSKEQEAGSRKQEAGSKKQRYKGLGVAYSCSMLAALCFPASRSSL